MLEIGWLSSLCSTLTRDELGDESADSVNIRLPGSATVPFEPDS